MNPLILLEIGKTLANKLPTIAAFLLQLPIWLGVLTLGVTMYITLSALVSEILAILQAITSGFPLVWCVAQAMGLNALLSSFVTVMTLFVSVSFFMFATTITNQIKIAATELVKI